MISKEELEKYTPEELAELASLVLDMRTKKLEKWMENKQKSKTKCVL
ncbi:MAG: hypothetical protein HZA82_00095 [Thaumarchaeota archaeon]|nr:hypothetical protein [Nitrososphaerota archaeon]